IPRLTTSHGPVFLVNSRFPLASATPPSSGREVHHQTGLPFSQSYGDNLPSSLTMVHPNASVFSTRPPASVSGTGRPQDRKSTRLNSSHVKISYAVFCLKNK